MNSTFFLGTALTAVGLAGYGIGLATPYPGRAFSVTAFMVGVALLAMRDAFDATEGPG